MRALKLALLLVSFAVSLLLGLFELVGRVDIVCKEASCMRVQTSSFGRLFGVPTPFFASIGLLLAIILLFKREEFTLVVVSFLAGAEAYLTFLQAFFIERFCKICLAFFGVLLVLFILYSSKSFFRGGLVFVFAFLLLHFIFFFPKLSAVPWDPLVEPKEGRIVLYMSPSCPHCEEAEKALREFVKGRPIELVYRPVSLSQKDREKLLYMLTKGKSSPLLKRVADRISWRNEDELLALTGRIAVPVLVLERDGRKLVLKGWGPRTYEEVLAFFSAFEPPYGVHPFYSPGEEGICTEEGPCR